MKIRVKLVACAGFLLAACAGPKVALAPKDQEVGHIRQLIAEETEHRFNLDIEAVAQSIVSLSHQYELDPMLVLAIIKIESCFNPRAHSHAGAIGLMQVMPIVAKEFRSDVDVHQRSDLYNTHVNLYLGIRYFSALRDQYERDTRKALVAYNIGPTALNHRLNHRGFAPTSYSRKVMKQYISYLTKKRGLFKIT